MTPQCPKCGSTEGYLGTQFAYFHCYSCKREQYWLPNDQTPTDWMKAVLASPWGATRYVLERLEAPSSQEACSKILDARCDDATGS